MELVPTRADDPDRLLPGETPNTTDLDDVRHWVAVYRELVRFKQRLLVAFEPDGDRKAAPQPSSLQVTELSGLLAQYERLQRRLVFWEARARDLAAR